MFLERGVFNNRMNSLLGYLGVNELLGLFFFVLGCMSVNLEIKRENLVSYCSILFVYYVVIFFYRESNGMLYYSGEFDLQEGTLFLLEHALIFFMLIYLGTMYFDEEKELCRIESVVLFFILLGSVVVMYSCVNFVNYVLCYELISFIYFYFISSNNRDIRNIESVVRYYIFSVLTVISLFCSVLCFYIVFGTSDFFVLVELMLVGLVVSELKIGLLFRIVNLLLFLSFMFKMYLIPFHSWVVNVYDTCKRGSLVIISSVFPLIYVIIFLKMYFYFFSLFVFFKKLIFFIVGSITFVIGSIRLLNQIRLRRLLVYSTMSSFGSLFFFFSIAEGNMGVFFYEYVFNYVVNVLIIMCIILGGRTDKKREIETMLDLVGLSKESPSLSVVLSLSIFSLGGIPPFIGFYFKLIVSFTVLYFYELLSVILYMVVSLFLFFSYIRIIRFFFFETVRSIIFSFNNTMLVYVLFLFSLFNQVI